MPPVSAFPDLPIDGNETVHLIGRPACHRFRKSSQAIVMGVIMSVIPVLSIVAASDRLPGGLVAILTSTELPMAVLAGALILGETVTPLIVGGVCVILAAIALAQLDGR